MIGEKADMKCERGVMVDDGYYRHDNSKQRTEERAGASHVDIWQGTFQVEAMLHAKALR